MKPLLSVRHVTAGYEKKPVVSDVSFGVRAGEMCALLGLNGSGKTTLLKAICGLLPVMDGCCLVNDMEYNNLTEQKRARYISYIPQRHSALKGMTVLDTVLMGFNPHLGLIQNPTTVQKNRARNIINQMGLEGMAEKDFSHLSEGQKKLTLVCRTIMQDTPVLLMDEPDNTLDFMNKRRILTTIRQMIQEKSKAGLITLHDPNLAFAYCDTMVLLHEGTMIKQIRIADASCSMMQEALSVIYQDMSVIEHHGRMLMFPDDKQD